MHCPVRMWLFSIVSLVFRVFSFTLIVTALRYWALPLYFFLILGAIIIGAWANTDHESFVIIGSKSLLLQVFKDYDSFQIHSISFQRMNLMKLRKLLRMTHCLVKENKSQKV